MSPDDHDRDLSISELSLSDQTLKPFSLLAPPAPPEPDIDTEESEESEEPVVQQSQKQSAKAREEKLQSDIFILRKLNASFELFNEALQDTGSANQVILHFIHNPHPSQQLIFSALLLSSNKLRHFLTNMRPSWPDQKIIPVLYLTKNGRGPKQYTFIYVLFPSINLII